MKGALKKKEKYALQPVRSFSRIFSTIRPTVRIVGTSVTALASIAGIVAAFGWEAFSVIAVIGLCAAGYQLFRMSRHIRELEECLVAELPHHHKFLVEFLRTTYIARGKDIIVARNRGATVYRYENNFVVQGSDCSNAQIIKGRNVSQVPIRGIAFALVGGSSMSVESLGSKYGTDGGTLRSPEFLIDDDRFKIAFCPFPTPLPPNREFEITYSDQWKAAMRQKADGFFFPEALYFPDKIGELSVRLDFDFEIQFVAALEVDTERSSVATCDAQPVAVTSAPGLLAAYQWQKNAPSPGSIFVLYYQAK